LRIIKFALNLEELRPVTIYIVTKLYDYRVAFVACGL